MPLPVDASTVEKSITCGALRVGPPRRGRKSSGVELAKNGGITIPTNTFSSTWSTLSCRYSSFWPFADSAGTVTALVELLILKADVYGDLVEHGRVARAEGKRVVRGPSIVKISVVVAVEKEISAVMDGIHTCTNAASLIAIISSIIARHAA